MFSLLQCMIHYQGRTKSEASVPFASLEISENDLLLGPSLFLRANPETTTIKAFLETNSHPMNRYIYTEPLDYQLRALEYKGCPIRIVRGNPDSICCDSQMCDPQRRSDDMKPCNICISCIVCGHLRWTFALWICGDSCGLREGHK